jgi:hypothetical protein
LLPDDLCVAPGRPPHHFVPHSWGGGRGPPPTATRTTTPVVSPRSPRVALSALGCWGFSYGRGTGPIPTGPIFPGTFVDAWT